MNTPSEDLVKALNALSIEAERAADSMRTFTIVARRIPEIKLPIIKNLKPWYRQNERY